MHGRSSPDFSQLSRIGLGIVIMDGERRLGGFQKILLPLCQMRRASVFAVTSTLLSILERRVRHGS